MDWHQLLQLGDGMTEQERQQDKVAGRLFAVLTARLEDGAELAVRGQAKGSTQRLELASALLDIGQEITAVSEALLLMLGAVD